MMSSLRRGRAGVLPESPKREREREEERKRREKAHRKDANREETRVKDMHRKRVKRDPCAGRVGG